MRARAVIASVLTLTGLLALSASAQAAPVSTGTPYVSGNPWPGQTLQCSAYFSGATSYSAVWRRDDVDIAGTSSSSAYNYSPTYPVTDADTGHKLTCVVSASDDSGTT